MRSDNMKNGNAKLSSQVRGAMRQAFKSDYRLCRRAGLTRRQAVSICLRRAVESQEMQY